MAKQWTRDTELLEKVQQKAINIMKGLEHHYYEERMRGLGEHCQTLQGVQAMRSDFPFSIYAWSSFFCICLILSSSASSALERKKWRWEEKTWAWDLASYTPTWCFETKAPSEGTWKCKLESKGFFPIWSLRILVQLVLKFNKFFTESCFQDYWPSCDLRENCSCQTVPLLLHMLHTTDPRPKQRLIGGNTALLLFVTFIIYYPITLPHLRAQLGCTLREVNGLLLVGMVTRGNNDLNKGGLGESEMGMHCIQYGYLWTEIMW